MKTGQAKQLVEDSKKSAAYFLELRNNNFITEEEYQTTLTINIKGLENCISANK